MAVAQLPVHLELGLQPHHYQKAHDAHDGVSHPPEPSWDALRELEDEAHDDDHHGNRETDGGHVTCGVACLRTSLAETVGAVVVVTGLQADLALGTALAFGAHADRSRRRDQGGVAAHLGPHVHAERQRAKRHEAPAPAPREEPKHRADPADFAFR